MKVLTEADGMMLANLCQAWSTMVKAQTQLTEKGILYKTPNGYIQQSPFFSMVNQCIDHHHEAVQGVWSDSGRAIADGGAD
jgi:P27 family predicted phage terminase small subunit